MSNLKKSNVFVVATNNGENIKEEGVRRQNHCPVQPEPGNIFLSKRISSTVYHVGVHFNPESKETFQDKILRLVRNDLNLTPTRAKMELPQTGRVFERGS